MSMYDLLFFILSILRRVFQKEVNIVLKLDVSIRTRVFHFYLDDKFLLFSLNLFSTKFTILTSTCTIA